MNKEIKFQKGSGNVFYDLGFDNADELLVKAELVRKISAIITKNNLNKVEASQLLGIEQSEFSALIKGNILGFSTESIFSFLNILLSRYDNLS